VKKLFPQIGKKICAENVANVLLKGQYHETNVRNKHMGPQSVKKPIYFHDSKIQSFCKIDFPTVYIMKIVHTVHIVPV
jgi:hypothetical protein